MLDLLYFDNGLKKAKLTDLNKIKNKQLWIDITSITPEERDIIQKSFDLHTLTAEDLFNSNIRIKIEEFPNYLLCVFYGIKKEKNIQMVELDFIIGANFLITNHKSEIESYNLLKSNKEKLENIFKKGNEFLFHKLLDGEIDNYFPVLEKIDDQIEDIEDEITKKTRPEIMTHILKLKRQIVSIKKLALPQREKISFLTKNDNKFISKKAIPYFRDIYDHSIKVADTIDNYREAIGSTFDAYMSAVSNNMNEVMKTLSIIATIALPLGIISGIFGTNFDILPGQHIPFGFWLMILLMLLFAGFMIRYFKRKGWF
ncbi:MAG: magnesium/cobalt transporter CorA [Candidatus Lokiarchaeota archaeon]|nr:magnesium/cobalt transporter CorA [Candidatus Lokiarchaeota archaeon]